MNWIGLLRSLQAEIMGLVGALLLILVIWLLVRAMIGRGAAGVTRTRRAWTDRCASLLALVLIGGMLWHVMTVVSANRLPRQDVDGSPVYERMDAITKK